MDIPEVIYHYTTKETFLKIFAQRQTPQLRMYPVNQMNDPMECKWLLDRISNQLILPGVPQNCPIESIQTILAERHNNIFQFLQYSKYCLEYYSSIYPQFLGSFTIYSGIENGLTLWREYAAQGTGLSIGICPKTILSQNTQTKNLYFGKVIYEKEPKPGQPSFYNEIADFFSKILSYASQITEDLKQDTSLKGISFVEQKLREFLLDNQFEFLSKIFNNIYKETILKNLAQIGQLEYAFKNIKSIFLLRFIFLLNIINCFIKQIAYEPEYEYRFVQFAPEAFISYDLQMQIIPEDSIDRLIQLDPIGKTYFPLPLNNDIIQEIIIGPNCSLSGLDVQTILKQHNITAKVQKSQIHMVQKS